MTNPETSFKRFFRGNKLWLWIAIILLTVISIFASQYVRASKYIEYKSPTGEYRLVVYRYPQFIAMPGQAGDASGYVVLTGPGETELQRQNVEMVQLVNKPRWTKTTVSVKLLFDWKLH